MADEDLPILPGEWERRLTAEVVTPLEAGRAASIATAAAAAAGAGGIAAAATLTAATATKVTAAVLVTVTVGGAIAAAAGILPDPIQSWVADLVDGIGISLPRPDEVVTTVPVPVITVPEITLPSVPLP